VVLDFLSIAGVGGLVPALGRGGEPNEALEWEPRQRRETGGERRQEAEGLEAKGEEQPLFLLTASFTAFAEEV